MAFGRGHLQLQRVDRSTCGKGAVVPRTATLRGFPVHESLVLTDEQLIAHEVVRGGADLLLRVDLTATVLTEHPGHLVPTTGHVAYRVPAAAWHGLLDAVGAQVSITARVPSPLADAVPREGDPDGEAGESTARPRCSSARRGSTSARAATRSASRRAARCCRRSHVVTLASDQTTGDVTGRGTGGWRAAGPTSARRRPRFASAAHHDDDVTAAMT